MKLALYKGRKTWFSHAIYWKQRLIDKQPKNIAIYTHVELFDGVKWWYSSSEVDKGVRRKAIEFNPDHWDFIDLNLSSEDNSRVAGWCLSKRGQDYDTYAIIFAQVFNLNKHKADKWFCSEFCTAALQSINDKRVNGVSAHLVTPADLYNLLK